MGSLVNFSPDAPPTSANPIEDRRGPVNITTVNLVANTSALALAANENRAYYLVRNAGNTPAYLTEAALSGTATVANAAYIVQPGRGWEESFNGSPRYTGAILAIATSACQLIISEANLIP
jgi:hypothetical protein